MAMQERTRYRKGKVIRMSDNKMYTQDELQLIATAAIASVVPTPDMTEEQWQKAIIRRASTIQRMRFLQEGSILMNVLDSIRIRATVISVEYEESSTRYVITYHAANGEEGSTESIRTPRTDGYYGKMLAPDIERLKGCAGSNNQVVIFKHNEVPTEEQAAEARKQGKTIPAAGYRQAVWFEFLD